ncbi:hypothetical protein COCOBI_05-3850 [Coccomyxa sp. Obi]|nr:hypothetical protein COCOBI_05-3850 [Coccomyxa sp. Obi]
MTSSSDSESNDESCPDAVLERYRIANYASALQQSYNYKRAAEELVDIWRCVANRDPKVRKALTEPLLDDTMMALRACDGLERNREACKRLVMEALKVLPQAKRKQLQRFVKTQSILASKEHKRAGRGLDPADQGLALADLAPDLLTAVFSHLGPCSLAVAACVCRTWRTEANKESRWRTIYEKAHGVPVRTESFTSTKHYFRDSVAEIFKGKGRQCLPHRSGRRLRDGCPVWLDDCADHESSPLLCLLVKEVSAYILEGRGFGLVSDEHSDSSDDEEVYHKVLGGRKLWRH